MKIVLTHSLEIVTPEAFLDLVLATNSTTFVTAASELAADFWTRLNNAVRSCLDSELPHG